MQCEHYILHYIVICSIIAFILGYLCNYQKNKTNMISSSSCGGSGYNQLPYTSHNKGNNQPPSIMMNHNTTYLEDKEMPVWECSSSRIESFGNHNIYTHQNHINNTNNLRTKSLFKKPQLIF